MTRPPFLVALLLVLAAPGTGAADTPAAPAFEPTRIMLLGDSVTHGSEGDWTWRYRLWKHLARSGGDADLVGPDRHLFAGQRESSAYADRRFDRDHAATWGMWAGAGAVQVGGLVAEHRPDVLVVMLGINDLLLDASAAAVVSSLREIVEGARAEAPEIDVVLTEVTQTWFTADGRATAVNAALPGLATSLTGPESRVVVAHAAHGYRIGHTYDTSHPSAQGEVRIAAAVADALSGLGLGAPYPRPLARVGNVPRPRVVVRAEPRRRAVRLTWEPPAGATSFYVWHRDVSRNKRWRRLPHPVTGTRLRITGLKGGHRYAFRMRARKGTVTVTDVTSRVVLARPKR